MHPIEENARALSDVLPHVESLLALHREAIDTLSRGFGQQPARTDECVLLLGVHAHNLSESLLRLIASGRFDVAAYLLRPAWDVGGLILATGSDEAMAERFWNEDLKPGEARKWVIDHISGELADVVRGFADDEVSEVAFDQLPNDRGAGWGLRKP